MRSIQNMKKVLVFGTFDQLHPGHLNFFKQAKKRGDFLIVVLARDINIKKIKKHFPIDNEKVRIAKLRKIKIINQIVLGSRFYRQRTRVIKKVKPNIICLGYDQPMIKLKDKKIKIVRLLPYQTNKYKSSLLSK